MSRSGASPGPVLPDVPLRCHAGISLRVWSDGECDVVVPRGRFRTGPETLSVLAVFVEPRTVAEAIALLESQLLGRRAAISVLDSIVQLFRLGALEPASESRAFPDDAKREAFGAAPIHASMLEDAARTSAWIEAVRATVRAGDVVVDVGTGTGVLAIAAACAGARRVYAIEASGAALAARAMVETNGVADRVTVLRGWSTAIELEERADVMVSELLDDNLLRESFLEVTADAVRRLLKPEPRFVPRRIALYAVLVEIPEKDREPHLFTASSVLRWGARYGLDFSALVDSFGRGTVDSLRRSHAARCRPLSDPVPLVDLEVGPNMPELVDETARLVATASGQCHGILTFFEAEVTAGRSVWTDPWRSEGPTSWGNPTLFLAHPIELTPGRAVEIRYRYPAVPTLEVSA